MGVGRGLMGGEIHPHLITEKNTAPDKLSLQEHRKL